ncbi:C13 family peptidase [Vibrio atypicus]|uniref:C13 family peptidase n=1 Tax=Vibrio atypicus TaxID=558271 RepID=UPI003735AD05
MSRLKFPSSILFIFCLLLTGCANQALLDAQPTMVSQQSAQLVPQSADKVDMYFVGFAANAYQDVFMKEVTYVQKLFDSKFDTQGRSLLLINNKKTQDSYPMATSTNLATSLNNIGQQMDRERDVLFLFLTGHGEYRYGLSASFGPNHNETISPNELKTILDESQIKWRVVVVSACFSGSFVKELADLNTLVITAADPYQPSFGCTNTAEFTFFGEAFFKNNLTRTHSFFEAFLDAKQEVTIKENKLGYDNSNPMYQSAKPIDDQLSLMDL